RFAALRGQTGIEVTDPPVEEKRALLCRMAELSGAHGIRLDVCCQGELVSGPVGKAHCVDIDRLQALSQAPLAHVSRKGTRKECGCSYSRDIGAYHTCSHECVYCYANL
ncbi:DUF1848 domain-containing protein, partial [bacterium]|nr:DUF1848 domain-containing protein [bacterium]